MSQITLKNVTQEAWLSDNIAYFYGTTIIYIYIYIYIYMCVCVCVCVCVYVFWNYAYIHTYIGKIVVLHKYDL